MCSVERKTSPEGYHTIKDKRLPRVIYLMTNKAEAILCSTEELFTEFVVVLFPLSFESLGFNSG